MTFFRQRVLGVPQKRCLNGTRSGSEGYSQHALGSENEVQYLWIVCNLREMTTDNGNNDDIGA